MKDPIKMYLLSTLTRLTEQALEKNIEAAKSINPTISDDEITQIREDYYDKINSNAILEKIINHYTNARAGVLLVGAGMLALGLGALGSVGLVYYATGTLMSIYGMAPSLAALGYLGLLIAVISGNEAYHVANNKNKLKAELALVSQEMTAHYAQKVDSYNTTDMHKHIQRLPKSVLQESKADNANTGARTPVATVNPITRDDATPLLATVATNRPAI